MAPKIQDLTIALQFKDVGSQAVINKVKNSLAQLQLASNNLRPNIQGLREEILRQGRASVGSVSNIRAQADALRALRDEAQIGGREFQSLTADIQKLDRQLARVQSKRAGGLGGALRTAGGVASTALGAGVFGGPEGFVGAIGGGLIGGLPGAAVGAVGGAAVGNVRKQAGALAETVASFNRYKIALAGVSADQKDFNESINAAKGFSEQFVVPLDKTIEQYTKLKASVTGAGLGTEETNKAFEALSAAVLATGGNTEDLSSALRATSQVFSKGKVSAEELRQQIGERLPGAFTIFADSMGITTQQLDKLLEDGEVTLKDFVGFTEELISRFSGTSAELASAPELAGARLQVAISKATLAYGGFFQKVGAGFQDYTTELLNFAINNKDTFIDIAADVAAFTEEMVANVKRTAVQVSAPFVLAFEVIKTELTNLYNTFKGVFDLLGSLGRLVLRADTEGFDLPTTNLPSVEERATAIRKQLEALFAEFTPDKIGLSRRDSASKTGEDELKQLTESKDISSEMLDIQRRLNEAKIAGNLFLVASLQFEKDMQVALESQTGPNDLLLKQDNARTRLNQTLAKLLANNTDQVKKMKPEITEVDRLFKRVENTIARGMTDAIFGLIDGTKKLGESLSNVLRQLGRLVVQFGMQSFVDSIFPNAKGNVYAENKIVPFAYGGIVNKPTLFPMANGAGLMGEAGPEAIMPLRRGRDGKLGVEASGGVGNVVVNVDASGSRVQGDQPNAKALGSAIGAAVQAEIVRQKRPGGLLS